jgi:hypothetical protein
MNEDIMESFLLSIIDKSYFPQLRCLRLMNCKNISSAWPNIDQWIDFILTRINEHEPTCVRFDFIEKEHDITDLQTNDDMIIMNDPRCIIDIHRFLYENHVALSMERKK